MSIDTVSWHIMNFYGFCSDNIQDLSLYCKMLLENDSLAKRIGLEGRKSAIEYFGKDKIKEQWTEFFKRI